jgi:hypothetical protein
MRVTTSVENNILSLFVSYPLPLLLVVILTDKHHVLNMDLVRSNVGSGVGRAFLGYM